MRYAAITLLASCLLQARAAQPWTENFTSGMNGWTNSGAPVWLAGGGQAQVTLPASPAPQSAILLCTGALSSASFTGDYATADLGLLGFRFRAAQVLPSVLTLRWMRGTNGYFRNLQHLIAATGIWYAIYCSMEDKDTGGWSGDDAGLFSYVRGGVDSVSVSVLTPSTLAPATFQVDDLMVDHLHRATYAGHDAGTSGSILWDHLQSNATYRVEMATSPGQAWIEASTVVASSNRLTLTNALPVESSCWRLVLP